MGIIVVNMDKLTRKERKAYKRKHGLPREERVTREGAAEAPDPSRGGSRGFPTWFRRRMVAQTIAGQPAPKSMKRSVTRWKNERLVPYEMTGNKSRRGMPGHHRFLLAIFKKIYPQATANACAVFIACHWRDHAVFTQKQISNAIVDLGMTLKKASTTATAYQAFTPENLELHYRFWNYSFPAGVHGLPRRDLIDIDECAIELKNANLNYGHAVRGLRVRKVGNYGRGRFKLALILAIEPGDPTKDAHEEGSVENPRIWHRLSTDRGTSTSTENYIDFLNEDLMDYFDSDERKRTMMHDNLSSHKSDAVVDAIYNRGHRVICRVPYRPNEAPIEFAFDVFACEVRSRWKSIKDEDDLVRECNKILDSKEGMKGFNKLFSDCGYVCEG